MKKITLFFFLLISLTALKCSKDPVGDQLPPITTNGANTFGCKVDGKVWLPYSGWNIDRLKVSAVFGIGIINPGFEILSMNGKNSPSSNLVISVKNFTGVGNYKIYNQLNDGLKYSDGNNSYEPFDTFGVVQISHCDTSQKIISGTFSFVGYTDHTHATKVNITDGRFDVHYPLTIH